MKENIPQLEKEKLVDILERFLALSDEPGKILSYQEKLELIKKSRKGDERALKELEENKRSKYRVNSFTTPLGFIKLFLDSPESQNIPDEKKKELSLRVDKAIADVKEAGRGLISEKEVKEVVDIVNEVKTFI